MFEESSGAAPAADLTDAIDIDASFFSQLEQSNPTEDPRMVRWGYNPGVRSTTLPPRETGLKDLFIPIGKFIAHTSFKTPQENCTLDEYKPKEYYVDVTAADAQMSFERSLGKDASTGRDWGYRSFGYGESDAVKMAAINQILLPTLQQIRSMFGNDVIGNCDGEDEMDLGNDRTHCSSCHLEWIKSEACKVLIQDAVATGRTINVRTPNGVRAVEVKFSLDQVEETRKVVQLGLELYKRQAHKDWSTVLNEHENGLRDQIQDAEHFLRKDLHQPRPQNKDAALIAKVIEAQGRPQAPAPAAPQADHSEVIQKLAEGQAMMAESMAKTNEILATMALNQQQAAAPAAVTPVEAAPGKAAKSK